MSVVSAGEQAPLPVAAAARAVARCAVLTAWLLARRRIQLRREHVGQRLRFADGTAAAVYRETVIEHPLTARPAVLLVTFRLRGVRSQLGHALFRWESILNTVLFAGFAGLVSKLWLANDNTGAYRGLYQWDDPALAEAYARALWRVLALVSERGSIRYHILPDLTRDQLLSQTVGEDDAGPPDWWRVTAAG